MTTTTFCKKFTDYCACESKFVGGSEENFYGGTNLQSSLNKVCVFSSETLNKIGKLSNKDLLKLRDLIMKTSKSGIDVTEKMINNTIKKIIGSSEKTWNSVKLDTMVSNKFYGGIIESHSKVLQGSNDFIDNQFTGGSDDIISVGEYIIDMHEFIGGVVNQISAETKNKLTAYEAYMHILYDLLTRNRSLVDKDQMKQALIEQQEYVHKAIKLFGEIKKELSSSNNEYLEKILKLSKDGKLSELKTMLKNNDISESTKKDIMTLVKMQGTASVAANKLRELLHKLNVTETEFRKLNSTNDVLNFVSKKKLEILKKHTGKDRIKLDKALRDLESLAMDNVKGYTTFSGEDIGLPVEPIVNKPVFSGRMIGADEKLESLFKGGDFMELDKAVKYDLSYEQNIKSYSPLKRLFIEQNAQHISAMLDAAKDAAAALRKKNLFDDGEILYFVYRLSNLRGLNSDRFESFYTTAVNYNAKFVREEIAAALKDMIEAGKKIQNKIPEIKKFVDETEKYRQFLVTFNLNEKKMEGGNLNCSGLNNDSIYEKFSEESLTDLFFGGYVANTLNDVIDIFSKSIILARMQNGLNLSVEEIKSYSKEQDGVNRKVIGRWINDYENNMKRIIDNFARADDSVCFPVHQELFERVLKDNLRGVKSLLHAVQAIDAKVRTAHLKIIENPTAAKDLAELLSKVAYDTNWIVDSDFTLFKEFIDLFHIESVGSNGILYNDELMSTTFSTNGEKWNQGSTVTAALIQGDITLEALHWDNVHAAFRAYNNAFHAHQNADHLLTTYNNNDYIKKDKYSPFPYNIQNCLKSHVSTLVLVTEDGENIDKEKRNKLREMEKVSIAGADVDEPVVNYYRGKSIFPAKITNSFTTANAIRVAAAAPHDVANLIAMSYTVGYANNKYSITPAAPALVAGDGNNGWHLNINTPIAMPRLAKFLKPNIRALNYAQAQAKVAQAADTVLMMRNLFSVFSAIDKAYGTEDSTGKSVGKMGAIYNAIKEYMILTSMYPTIYHIGTDKKFAAGHIALREFGHPIVSPFEDTNNMEGFENYSPEILGYLDQLTLAEYNRGSGRKLDNVASTNNDPFPMSNADIHNPILGWKVPDFTHTRKGFFKEMFAKCDMLLIMSLKSMFVKITSTLSMFNLINFTPSNFMNQSTLRTIYGGDLNTFYGTPNIIPENTEVYIRVFYYLSFYKTLFFEEIDAVGGASPTTNNIHLVAGSKRMALLPEDTVKFGPLMQLFFIKWFDKNFKLSNKNVDNVNFNDVDISTFVSECNILAEKYTGSDKTIKIIKDLVNEVNRRYGVVTTDEILQKMKKDKENLYPGMKRLQSRDRSENLKKVINFPKPLLDGEEEPTKLTVPSQEKEFASSLIGRATSLIKPAVGDYYFDELVATVYNFRKKLEKAMEEFDKEYEAMFDTVQQNKTFFTKRSGLTELINRLRIKLTLETTPLNRFRLFKSFLFTQGDDLVTRVSNEVLLYRELVYTPASLLYKIYTRLIAHINLYGRYQIFTEPLLRGTFLYYLDSVNTDLVDVNNLGQKAPRLDFSRLEQTMAAFLEQVREFHLQLRSGIDEASEKKMGEMLDNLIIIHRCIFESDGLVNKIDYDGTTSLKSTDNAGGQSDVKNEGILINPIVDYSEYAHAAYVLGAANGQNSFILEQGIYVLENENTVRIKDPRSSKMELEFPDLNFEILSRSFNPKNIYVLFEYLLITLYKKFFEPYGKMYAPLINEFISETSMLPASGFNLSDKNVELGGPHKFEMTLPFSNKILDVFRTLNSYRPNKTESLLESDISLLPKDYISKLEKTLPTFMFYCKFILKHGFIQYKMLSNKLSYTNPIHHGDKLNVEMGPNNAVIFVNNTDLENEFKPILGAAELTEASLVAIRNNKKQFLEETKQFNSIKYNIKENTFLLPKLCENAVLSVLGGTSIDNSRLNGVKALSNGLFFNNQENKLTQSKIDGSKKNLKNAFDRLINSDNFSDFKSNYKKLTTEFKDFKNNLFNISNYENINFENSDNFLTKMIENSSDEMVLFDNFYSEYFKYLEKKELLKDFFLDNTINNSKITPDTLRNQANLEPFLGVIHCNRDRNRILRVKPMEFMSSISDLVLYNGTNNPGGKAGGGVDLITNLYVKVKKTEISNAAIRGGVGAGALAGVTPGLVGVGVNFNDQVHDEYYIGCRFLNDVDARAIGGVAGAGAIPTLAGFKGKNVLTIIRAFSGKKEIVSTANALYLLHSISPEDEFYIVNPAVKSVTDVNSYGYNMCFGNNIEHPINIHKNLRLSAGNLPFIMTNCFRFVENCRLSIFNASLSAYNLCSGTSSTFISPDVTGDPAAVAASVVGVAAGLAHGGSNGPTIEGTGKRIRNNQKTRVVSSNTPNLDIKIKSEFDVRPYYHEYMNGLIPDALVSYIKLKNTETKFIDFLDKYIDERIELIFMKDYESFETWYLTWYKPLIVGSYIPVDANLNEVALNNPLLFSERIKAVTNANKTLYNDSAAMETTANVNNNSEDQFFYNYYNCLIRCNDRAKMTEWYLFLANNHPINVSSANDATKVNTRYSALDRSIQKYYLSFLSIMFDNDQINFIDNYLLNSALTIDTTRLTLGQVRGAECDDVEPIYAIIRALSAVVFDLQTHDFFHVDALFGLGQRFNGAISATLGNAADVREAFKIIINAYLKPIRKIFLHCRQSPGFTRNIFSIGFLRYTPGDDKDYHYNLNHYYDINSFEYIDPRIHFISLINGIPKCNYLGKTNTYNTYDDYLNTIGTTNMDELFGLKNIQKIINCNENRILKVKFPDFSDEIPKINKDPFHTGPLLDYYNQIYLMINSCFVNKDGTIEESYNQIKNLFRKKLKDHYINNKEFLPISYKYDNLIMKNMGNEIEDIYFEPVANIMRHNSSKEYGGITGLANTKKIPSLFPLYSIDSSYSKIYEMLNLFLTKRTNKIKFESNNVPIVQFLSDTIGNTAPTNNFDPGFLNINQVNPIFFNTKTLLYEYIRNDMASVFNLNRDITGDIGLMIDAVKNGDNTSYLRARATTACTAGAGGGGAGIRAVLAKITVEPLVSGLGANAATQEAYLQKFFSDIEIGAMLESICPATAHVVLNGANARTAATSFGGPITKYDIGTNLASNKTTLEVLVTCGLDEKYLAFLNAYSVLDSGATIRGNIRTAADVLEERHIWAIQKSVQAGGKLNAYQVQILTMTTAATIAAPAFPDVGDLLTAHPNAKHFLDAPAVTTCNIINLLISAYVLEDININFHEIVANTDSANAFNTVLLTMNKNMIENFFITREPDLLPQIKNRMNEIIDLIHTNNNIINAVAKNKTYYNKLINKTFIRNNILKDYTEIRKTLNQNSDSANKFTFLANSPIYKTIINTLIENPFVTNMTHLFGTIESCFSGEFLNLLFYIRKITKEYNFEIKAFNNIFPYLLFNVNSINKTHDADNKYPIKVFPIPETYDLKGKIIDLFLDIIKGLQKFIEIDKKFKERTQIDLVGDKQKTFKLQTIKLSEVVPISDIQGVEHIKAGVGVVLVDPSEGSGTRIINKNNKMILDNNSKPIDNPTRYALCKECGSDCEESKMLERTKNVIKYASIMYKSFAAVFADIGKVPKYMQFTPYLKDIQNFISKESQSIAPISLAVDLIPTFINTVRYDKDETDINKKFKEENIIKSIDSDYLKSRHGLGLHCANIRDLDELFLGSKSPLLGATSIFMLDDKMHQITLNDFPWFKSLVDSKSKSQFLYPDIDKSSLESYMRHFGKLTKYLYEIEYKNMSANMFGPFNSLDCPKFQISTQIGDDTKDVFNSGNIPKVYGKKVVVQSLRNSLPIIIQNPKLGNESFSYRDFMKMYIDVRYTPVVAGGAGVVAGLIEDTISFRESEMLGSNEIITNLELSADVSDLTNYLEKNGGKFSSYTGGLTGGNTFDKRSIDNILDIGILPINIHGMMREIPLANTINNNYSFDIIINNIHNKIESGINSQNSGIAVNNGGVNDSRTKIGNLGVAPGLNNIDPKNIFINGEIIDIYEISLLKNPIELTYIPFEHDKNEDIQIHDAGANESPSYFVANSFARRYSTFKVEKNLPEPKICIKIANAVNNPADIADKEGFKKKPVNYDHSEIVECNNAVLESKPIMDNIPGGIRSNYLIGVHLEHERHNCPLAWSNYNAFPIDLNSSNTNVSHFKLINPDLCILSNYSKSNLIGKLVKPKPLSISAANYDPIFINGIEQEKEISDKKSYYYHQTLYNPTKNDLYHGVDKNMMQPILGINIYSEVMYNKYRDLFKSEMSKTSRYNESTVVYGVPSLYTDLVDKP